MNQSLPKPRFLSRQEAANALGVPVQTVDRMVSVGLLDRYRIRGRYVRVLASQVDELSSLPVDWLMRC